MTRGAFSERSAARTSYEVSGLRFGYVLTVCLERLSWVPCWGPTDTTSPNPSPPPPRPPRTTGREWSDADNTALRREQRRAPGVHSDRKVLWTIGMRAGASPSSPPLLLSGSFSVPYSHPFHSHRPLRGSFEFSISLIYLRISVAAECTRNSERLLHYFTKNFPLCIAKVIPTVYN